MVDRRLIKGFREINEDDVHRPVTLDAGLFLPSTPGTGLGANDTFKETSVGPLIQTVITLSANSVTITDATTAGAHGSLKLFTCPSGLITFYGAYASISLTAGAGGIADDAAVVAAIGTAATATDNAALTTTEADIIPSTALTLASGTIAATDMKSTGTQIPTTFDGTSTAKFASLNFAVPDADSSANDTLAVTGDIFITWLLHGIKP